MQDRSRFCVLKGQPTMWEVELAVPLNIKLQIGRVMLYRNGYPIEFYQTVDQDSDFSFLGSSLVWYTGICFHLCSVESSGAKIVVIQQDWKLGELNFPKKNGLWGHLQFLTATVYSGGSGFLLRLYKASKSTNILSIELINVVVDAQLNILIKCPSWPWLSDQ